MKFEKVPAISLFQTPEFKDNSHIALLAAQAGDVWITRNPLPPGHFGSYFGAMGVRDTYENPYIADLYHLHECTHVVQTRYDPKMAFLDWSRKMIGAEFQASMMSECLVYLFVPGVRAKTFAHEIWVDRYLRPYKDAIDSGNKSTLADLAIKLGDSRARALNIPQYDDFLEHQIWNYCRQNVQWCRIWTSPVGTKHYGDTPAFRVVEEHMASPNRDETHLEWLESVSVYDAGTSKRIPFYNQAREFAEVYKRSNAHYGNWLLSK